MSNPQYERLTAIVAEIGALGSAVELLNWDRDVMMPKSPTGEGIALQIRSKELAALAGVMHDRFITPEVGKLIETLQDDPFLDAEQRAFVREVSFDYLRTRRLSTEFVRKESELYTKATGVWEVARKENDFGKFLPYLKEVFATVKERAHLIDATREPYAVLFEGYERGIPIDEVRVHFARIRDAIKPIIAKLPRTPSNDDAFLQAPISAEAQLAFNREMAEYLGYDFEKGRLDLTTHPFCGAFGRVATRLTDGPINTLFSTMHEVGHAMYEHNSITGNFDAFGTPLAQARGMSVHESQSRLWENNVGRSTAFWQHAYPRLQEAFAPAFTDVSLDRFIGAINKVEPGLIRVNADELTYPMHVFLRFEIEQDVLEGRLAVEDIPTAWNQKMTDYLGITPPDDAHGCLQDVHWSYGIIGYFPTYVIGSMLAAQEYAAAQRDIPHLEDKLALGDTRPLQDWLRTKIHEPACRYTTKELIHRATGKDPAPDDYIAYLTAKFG